MKSKQRLLITGVSGHLGSNLAFCLKERYEILGLYHSRRINIKGTSSRWADLRSFSHTQSIIKEFNPDIVIHCAAAADVDSCELSAEYALETNVLSVENLVRSLEDPQTKLIHISTDLVYEGTKDGAYCETDKVNPVNYYGLTKLDSEAQALKKDGALVLRTNFFGWGRAPRLSLAQWLIQQLKDQHPVQGLTDVYFSALYTFDLADLVVGMIDKNLNGIYNCGSSTAISKYEFLVQLAKKTGLNSLLIEPVSVDQFPFKAKRAKNLSLDISKLTRDIGVSLPTVQESIDHFVSDIDKNYPASMFDEVEKTVYKPYFDFIPYGRQAIDENDVKAVEEVLYSSNLTQGPRVEEFERGLNEYTGSVFCAAVNSGTAGLHIACLAAGVGPGDEVITCANTFVASANCIAYCSAKPVFADIDEKTYNVLPEDIEKKISPKTKAVVIVHFAGQSADMELICAAVKCAGQKFGKKIFIIEDASHALGSLYKNQKVGSSIFSDMTVFSFHPVKHITTGEGGAVLTNDAGLYRRLCLLRSHGITTSSQELIQKKEAFETFENDDGNPVRKTWYYEQQCLGFNYRITDLQCALGTSQLRKLPEFIKRRREIVGRYNQAFAGISVLQIPFESEKCLSNFHLYVLLMDFERIGKSRHKLMVELKQMGIHTQVHYIPVYTQPYYQKTFGAKWGDCPVTEAYYRRCLSIPLFPAMSDEDIGRVIGCVKKAAGVGHEN